MSRATCMFSSTWRAWNTSAGNPSCRAGPTWAVTPWQTSGQVPGSSVQSWAHLQGGGWLLIQHCKSGVVHPLAAKVQPAVRAAGSRPALVEQIAARLTALDVLVICYRQKAEALAAQKSLNGSNVPPHLTKGGSCSASAVATLPSPTAMAWARAMEVVNS